MLRNLEHNFPGENLGLKSSFTTIFPLGDASGAMRDTGCDYPELVKYSAFEQANSFQAKNLYAQTIIRKGRLLQGA